MKAEHPLSILSVDEINKAVEIYRSHNKSDDNSLFTNITLVEPSKEIVRDYKEDE